MTIKLEGIPQIENLRNYPAETVKKLRELLSVGAVAHADPRRGNYYDVENCSHVFFIHISPHNGRVLLLATWSKDSPQVTPQNSFRAPEPVVF